MGNGEVLIVDDEDIEKCVPKEGKLVCEMKNGSEKVLELDDVEFKED